MATKPGITVILSESPQYPFDKIPWMAKVAEDAGFTDVMLGEHVIYGPSASREGMPANFREFPVPFHQDPTLPSWAEPLVMFGAIAAVTSHIRLMLSAVIAPLRNPVLLAKQLSTLDVLSKGRLLVMPSVSWQPEEYEICQVPWKERGRRLDEHVEAWKELWTKTPASYHGRYYHFDNAYMEPKPVQPGGPTLFFSAGESMHDNFIRRVVRWGRGGVFAYFWPNDDDWAKLRSAMKAAGRDMSELEFVRTPLGMKFKWTGGGRGPCPVECFYEVMEQLAAQNSLHNILFKPALHIDDPNEFPALAKQVIKRWRACVS